MRCMALRKSGLRTSALTVSSGLSTFQVAVLRVLGIAQLKYF